MPVEPRCSLREPTRYHIWKDTIGLRWSSSNRTRSPLSSVAATTRSAARAADGARSERISSGRIAMRTVRLYRPRLCGRCIILPDARAAVRPADRVAVGGIRAAAVHRALGLALRAGLAERRVDPGHQDQQGQAAAALRNR